MNKYLSIESLTTCFKKQEEKLSELIGLLVNYPLIDARIFELPQIEKGEEHDQITEIQVNPLEGNEALNLGLHFYQKLFIHHNNPNISSKSASRLPGAICFSVSHQQYKEAMNLINEVNQLKAELENIVTKESGVSKEQRFEFVHNHLRGLITLNAYRTITPLLNPDTINFGWANKNIINKVTKQQILDRLEKSYKAGRAVPPYSNEQWAALVELEMTDIKKLPDDVVLKIKRPVKVQPITRVWYSELQKQVQYACPLPVIVFYTEDNEIKPRIGTLPDYNANAIKHRYKPKAKPLELVIPRLHLYKEI
ncbi:DNA replication terminus site-binding protein [Xenorhabdus nematophila]|uniref:DNA replication terminus site-binding protein n=1 Tax=Xenorhabdus nematophila (strain ATCC 19061 / DSM 3370 / CCUG 14189 / LMG 1036 / NCIMB 9965 / AN6) TaxID=406817 RepID=D3VFQ8_XENNA|nr:DNA replication terminus site-binding protein [Xenorhabdus nematophila]CEE89948.1 replication termination protein [Xenorhabdus nematophila str. Anatoliense]CEF29486.1 replication termination protein [Xenorhabdus nematophila str. Websteri]AYA40185.1 DNA replication terminus site-binding protein [Xenorhabdus nematophila]KHD27394.1 DNA replication terminus site-binding protein [Xenorhabdus nematophila]MBA0018854.1 DNA replication terminus site-binding protein [Xenorhabdus nematophila]